MNCFLSKLLLPNARHSIQLDYDEANRAITALARQGCQSSRYDNRSVGGRWPINSRCINNRLPFETRPSIDSVKLINKLFILSYILYYVLAVQPTAASTIVVRPTTGLATIVPGQPLHFECKMIGNKDAQYVW